VEVWVVVKMFQGVTDSVDVFTSRTDAYNELKKWIEEVLDEEDRRYVKDYGLEYTDVDGSDVHAAEIIVREGNLHSELLPLTPDETEHLIHALEYYDNDLRDNPDFFDSWTPEEIEEAKKIISGILRKATNEDD